MKQWVVTGYSSKMDGLLYIVEAHDEAGAFVRIVDILEGKYFQFESEEGIIINGITDRDDMTVQQMKEDIECEGSARWWWQVCTEEIEKDANLHDAVCW